MSALGRRLSYGFMFGIGVASCARDWWLLVLCVFGFLLAITDAERRLRGALLGHPESGDLDPVGQA